MVNDAYQYRSENESEMGNSQPIACFADGSKDKKPKPYCIRRTLASKGRQLRLFFPK